MANTSTSAATISLIFKFLSDTFGVPAKWFSTPQTFVLLFLIPLVSLIAVWAIVMAYSLRIFKNSAVNVGLGVVIALVTSFLIKTFTPAFVVGAGVGGSLMFSGRATFWRSAGALILAVVTFFLYIYAETFFGVSKFA